MGALGPGIAASETVGSRFEDDGVESSRSDAAQQLSASAWLTVGVELEPGSEFGCIGQALPATQHAIRASGVACQPAQSVHAPVLMASATTVATA